GMVSNTSSSSISAELVVLDPAAAYPAVPGGILLEKAGRHQGCWPLFGRIAFFSYGRLLLGRNLNTNLNRGYGHKLLINEPRASHIAIKSRATFTQQAANAEIPVENAHGQVQINDFPLARDNNLYMRMRFFSLQ